MNRILYSLLLLTMLDLKHGMCVMCQRYMKESSKIEPKGRLNEKNQYAHHRITTCNGVVIVNGGVGGGSENVL